MYILSGKSIPLKSVLTVVLIIFTTLIFAQDIYTTSDARVDSAEMNEISAGPIRKFGRGISNTAFGVVEIPLQAYIVNKKDGAFASLTYGVLKGVFYFITRELVGVLEIVTFPFPLPGATKSKYNVGWGYGVLMEPEWIFPDEYNPFDLIHQDFPVD